MKLIRVGILNGIAVFVRTVTLFILNKLLAVYVGPSGYVMIGQLQNAIQMLMSFSGNILNNGIVKYTAEYHEDEHKQHVIWRTSVMVAIYSVLFISLCMLLLHKQLAIYFLKNSSYSSIFIWFAFTLVFFVLNSLFLSILNGKKEIKKYIIINITGSLISLIFTSILAHFWGLYGALLALVTNQSIIFFVSLFVIQKTNWFKFAYIFGKIDTTVLRQLLKFALMAIASAICMPLSLILIRNEISNKLGLVAAGHWEAMWRISSTYLLLITTTLSLYYLPRFSELSSKSDIRKEVKKGYLIIMPILVIISILMFSFRERITIILFTKDFLPMTQLFAFQLLGDMVKVSGWLVGFLYTAKGLVKLYLFSEIIFCSLFFLLVSSLISKFGIKTAGIAYLITYVFHALFIFTSLKYKRIL